MYFTDYLARLALSSKVDSLRAGMRITEGHLEHEKKVRAEMLKQKIEVINDYQNRLAELRDDNTRVKEHNNFLNLQIHQITKATEMLTAANKLEEE